MEEMNESKIKTNELKKYTSVDGNLMILNLKKDVVDKRDFKLSESSRLFQRNIFCRK
jgi:hypothetical protein